MGNIPFGERIVLPGDPTSPLHAATKQYVDSMGTGLYAPLPAGSLVPFAGSTAPSGWLLCAGQAVSRSTYAILFAAIGTTYGTGDGSTTFNLPDLRGRVPAGLDNMNGTDAGRLDWANTLGTNGGEQKHTMTLAELVAHTHTTDSPVNFAGSGAFQGASQVAKGTTGSTGSTTPFNVMQPTILTNYIISTGIGIGTYACRVYNQSNTGTLNNITTTPIEFPNEVFDTASMHNTATNNSRIYLPVAGVYRVDAIYSFPNNTLGYRVLFIRKNGSVQQHYTNGAPYTGGDRTRMQINFEELYAANDYIELCAYHNAGSPLSGMYSASGWDTNMSVRLVQPS